MELTRITWRLAGVLALAAALGACGDGAERPAQRPPPLAATDPTVRLQEFAVPDGSHPHDVAPAGDGTVWYTAQATGRLGRLDPETGRTTEIPLGEGSAPHGVIVGPDGAAWITDGGPYAIATTPDGGVWYASLAGSHIAGIDLDSGKATVLEPPTPGQGARRVWSDSKGRLWVSEWNAGRLGRYDPAAERWREWELPGQGPQPYAVYVDDRDLGWLSDFAANALVRFDPATERFARFPRPTADGRVRLLLGRRGELWGA